MDLKSLVTTAAARPEVVDAMRHVYDDLQRQIDARKPVCVASGKCCNFDAYGHRLYVTTMELAAFVAQLPVVRSPPPDRKFQRLALMQSPPGCPFQIERLCSVHAIRPFGCRVFFCDPTSTQWQNDQYELFHTRLKAEHERFGVPYRYVEWRAALRELEVRDFKSGAPLQNR